MYSSIHQRNHPGLILFDIFILFIYSCYSQPDWIVRGVLPHINTKGMGNDNNMAETIRKPTPLNSSIGNDNPPALEVFHQSVREFHQRNFVKVVYTTLRDGNGAIQPNDFNDAIQFCQEFVTEVRFQLL